MCACMYLCVSMFDACLDNRQLPELCHFIMAPYFSHFLNLWDVLVLLNLVTKM